jgi:hypothetical protein
MTKKLRKFHVCLREVCYYHIDVKARNQEEANEEAERIFCEEGFDQFATCVDERDIEVKS